MSNFVYLFIRRHLEELHRVYVQHLLLSREYLLEVLYSE
jgi:hypothetical protein